MSLPIGKINQENAAKAPAGKSLDDKTRDTIEARLKPFEPEIRKAGGRVELSDGPAPSKANVHLSHMPEDLIKKIDAAL